VAKRARRPLTPLQDAIRQLWRIPLIALALSVALVMLTGSPWSSLRGFLLPTVTCTAIAMVFIVTLRHTLEPRVVARFAGDPRAGWVLAGMYLVTSLVATAIGLLVLNFTVFPGILGGPRDAMRMVSYSLMLGTLVTGATLSYSFYRRAVDRAGSDREMQLARNIQRSFLLSEFPIHPGLEVHAENVSSRQVSGDFYDVVVAGDGSWLLTIADVSGKGVPAALLSSMLQASLRTQAVSAASPGPMVTTVNRLACDRGTTGQFATLFLASVDTRATTLRYTNAGHNFPVLLRGDDGRMLLEEGGLLVGMLPAAEYTEGSVALEPGDRLVLYTDGVTEAVDATGVMFGEERLYAMLESLPRDLTARGIVERVLSGVRDFLGENEPGDDITVMALRVVEDGEARR
jgi:sigma-B regulation protein RsbU (phosphoserine phosphatase)